MARGARPAASAGSGAVIVHATVKTACGVDGDTPGAFRNVDVECRMEKKANMN